jgi:hypothetical protein
MSVLQPAEFGALPTINAGVLGGELQLVLLAGDEVHLSRQARDPEAVDDIGRFELQPHGLTRRNADFVCGDEALMRTVGFVANLPPPLVSDDLDDQRVAVLGEHRALPGVADE